jgi:beta-1,4-mannosyl-glycoprotein beta-1,4-N-acetylglucosaminyltransferase
MKIFDCFPFYNELELLELRLHTLDDIVDYFVITEAHETFSGKAKPLYFAEHRERFRKFEAKIIHNIIESTPDSFDSFEPPNDYFTRREVSYPHKSGGTPLSKLNLDFQREVFHRDSVINGLLGIAQPDDLIIISDVDEIPNPSAICEVIGTFIPGNIYNFCQNWYMYYFNVTCNKEWFGTRICDFASLKGRSVDLMRYHLENRLEQPGPIIENGGWHFSFLGGDMRVREKLSAYSYQGRRSKYILLSIDRLFPQRIKYKIKNNHDIFNTGRQFKAVNLDETFPEYLIQNKKDFMSMINPINNNAMSLEKISRYKFKDIVKNNKFAAAIAKKIKSEYKSFLRRIGLYAAPKMLQGELEFFSVIYKKCKVIVDVGARFDTDYIDISKNNNIVYYLFEANPYFYKKLKNNISKYKELIVAENVAVGDYDREIDYYADSESVLQNTTAVKNSKKRLQKKIRITRLSSYFKEKGIAQIDFLKTDIEEYDYYALIGAGDLLNQCKFIQFELGIGAPLNDGEGGYITNQHYYDLFKENFNLYIIKDENNPIWQSGKINANLIVLDDACKDYITKAQKCGIGFNIACINKKNDISCISDLILAFL